ncbi:MAG: APC family permease [Acidobacteriia bacterium]|nr:APC family permease [Terriglobia bacterium]
MSTDTLQLGPEPNVELRRDVSIWGSFMWGYADVGADIYTALGLVIAAAQGMASVAFAIAGLVYICIGLAYTELASAYPVAGGGHYYALRGLGDFWGFVAGVALLLDYTIDISLFSVASAGYFLSFWSKIITHAERIKHQIHLTSSVVIYDWVMVVVSLALILFLIWLNIRGMKESSLFNEILGALDIVTESTLVVCGFVFAWRPELISSQFLETWHHFDLHRFAYGTSLGIICFVGLESISQAAQETRRPATIIPRTSITLIITVFVFAVAFSNLSLGVSPWQNFETHMEDPVAYLATLIPFIGFIAGPFAAFLGMTILAISANSGIMSASRLTFSMSQLKLLSPWFDKVHQRYRTPARTIAFFSGLGILFVAASAFTPQIIDTLGNMYAFGATLGYIIVFASLIKLRFVDPYTPRPYHVPINFSWKRPGQVPVQVPILGFLGMVGVSMIFFFVVYTHAIGRIAGPAWVALCLLYYVFYRRSLKLPVLGSVKHDWEKEQMAVLTSAEEYDLLERYKLALLERDKILKKKVNGTKI